MATYTPASKDIPSYQRTVIITAVAVGDRIDLHAVLGRAARRVQMTTSSATDVVGYTLNSLRKIRSRLLDEDTFTVAQRAFGSYNTTLTDVWSSDGASFSTAGETITTASELQISSIQIDSLVLGVGTTITLVVW